MSPSLIIAGQASIGRILYLSDSDKKESVLWPDGRPLWVFRHAITNNSVHQMLPPVSFHRQAQMSYWALSVLCPEKGRAVVLFVLCLSSWQQWLLPSSSLQCQHYPKSLRKIPVSSETNSTKQRNTEKGLQTLRGKGQSCIHTNTFPCCHQVQSNSSISSLQENTHQSLFKL